MEKYRFILTLSLVILFIGKVTAQVSHGGSPLPLTSLRSTQNIVYEQMPYFDVAEELRIDSLNESDHRSGFRFAYKFMTNFNRSNSGNSFILEDGTKVWRLGIYSPGALSINVLFSEYELPAGAKLFLYDESQTQILGSFTNENNSELDILPVAPITGERIIIEYQEPRLAEFPGRLTVGEVNHGYRDFKGKEPEEGKGSLDEIPPLSCYADSSSSYNELGHSVVLMIIDGTTGCTGTLINNTQKDGKPYLLTASHCLNKSFTITNPDYEKVANSIVCFYNYNSPLCKTILRGTEEMTTASAHYRAVSEGNDMALLELLELPPVYYQPYLAGWNIENAGKSPFFCIQHPSYSTKRISLTYNNVELKTFTSSSFPFFAQSHWYIEKWDIGYTAGGSSGSALFNSNNRIIGALSGGQSKKGSPYNDYFYSLSKIWDQQKEENKQLKHWLDPQNTGAKDCEGMNPYSNTSCFRLSNVGDSGQKEKIECSAYSSTDSKPLFGNNSSGNSEYLEEYSLSGDAILHGTYIVTPEIGKSTENLNVEIVVYDSNNNSPYTLLYSETFKPSYLNLENDSFIETNKPLGRAQEHFIRFETPVKVNNRFYIGYKIQQASDEVSFAAYNLPKGCISGATTWIKEKDIWKKSTEYAAAGFATSLYLDPVIEYKTLVSNEDVTSPASEDIIIYVENSTKEIRIIFPDEETAKDSYFRIYSMKGELVEYSSNLQKENIINPKNINQGIYIIKVEGKNQSVTKKIVL